MTAQSGPKETLRRAASSPGNGLAAVFALVVSAFAAASLAAWDPPVEPPRVRQSSLTAFYAPSLGILSASTLPMHDNFSVEGSWVNLFPKGQNLNFYFGIGHSIKDASVFPIAAAETESFATVEQARDSVYGKFNYVFYDYFQFNGTVEYLQNRNVERASAYTDYDFNRLTFSGGLSWDLRYSSIEKYYKGKVFLFPEEGFRVAAGMREHGYSPAGASSDAAATWAPQAFGELQCLVHPHPFWVITLGASGEANLTSGSPRVQAASSEVIGAFETTGDYAADALLELRFLHPTGIFWESPEFWYISSFLFKFSPGFILGYDAGASGRYADGSRLFQQAFYASPLVAVRMNGDLVSVLRADFAIASSGLYKIVLSASFGTVAMGKPIPVVKTGIR